MSCPSFLRGQMNYRSRFKLRSNLLAFLFVFLLLPACAPTSTPTPFIPPKAPTATLPPPAQGQTPVIPTSTPQLIATASPTATPPCTDSLAFIKDVTVPDGTVVSPGASVEKQWLVQNNGTCNWDERYRLKFVGGLEMGAASEQALYPARAGSQATIRMTFIAPNDPGTYNTAWQAFDPNGRPFGDAIFMEIIVQPEAQVTLEVIGGGQ
jgi:hypothetical protein